ncbi:MAG: transglutaminase family protein [Chromatiaceae bacterium]|nr:transglutaminase family protein [Gammaproteobacteria bacterium]MCP5305599.1 transglutaminase family protein [Chromatiaceae bacterium]MCP5312456.1 transglutaminase family protein [Chromatiaceae bacterium]
MKYRVTHTTEYAYAEPVSLAHNETHLQPRDIGRQRVLAYRLEIDPKPAVVAERIDFFGNHVTYFALERPHALLRVTATTDLEIDTGVRMGHGASTLSWQRVVARLRGASEGALLDARQYVLESPMVRVLPELRKYAAKSFSPGRNLVEAVSELMQRIHEDFKYEPGATSVATPLDEMFAQRSGVCQDFAHLAIACLRAKNLPARYVSGYIETIPPPGQEKLTGSDASHAWFSVFDPEVGWLDFDPTNNQIPMDQHIVTAWGRDYADVTPLKGVIFGGGEHSARVAVDVTRGA